MSGVVPGLKTRVGSGAVYRRGKGTDCDSVEGFAGYVDVLISGRRCEVASYADSGFERGGGHRGNAFVVGWALADGFSHGWSVAGVGEDPGESDVIGGWDLYRFDRDHNQRGIAANGVGAGHVDHQGCPFVVDRFVNGVSGELYPRRGGACADSGDTDQFRSGALLYGFNRWRFVAFGHAEEWHCVPFVPGHDYAFV